MKFRQRALISQPHHTALSVQKSHKSALYLAQLKSKASPFFARPFDFYAFS
jgi:hypothetical protein